MAISRRQFLRAGAAGIGGLIVGCSGIETLTEAASRGTESRRPVNVLFINTDQQRFDAMSCAGNDLVRTPNLDRLAREGVRFTYAFTPQPMCAAARTSFHTGLSIHTTGCVSVPHDPDMQFGGGTFDQNLARHGYHTEYHGRWHEPPCLTDCYENEVTLDFIGPYKRYLRKTLGDPPKPKSGQFISYLSDWPYTPDAPDYELRKSLGNIPGNNCPGVEYGVYDLPAEHTYSAFVANETIDALKRLKDKPFSISAAILHPHHPEYVPRPYAGSIDPEKMRLPLTMHDRRLNTADAGNPWQIDGTEMRNMKLIHARYYELVEEADHHIGRILKALDDLDLADNTLVIFIADHGEMLGCHGLTQKFVPYQESVRIPMLMRLPGQIRAGTTIDHPVNSLDTLATIFDYLGLPCPKQEGHSLRPPIEGRTHSCPEYTLSEMDHYTMFASREWKYVWYNHWSDVDVLYDLRSDPMELTNLLGANPDRSKWLPQAREIRKEMLAWMEQIKHRDRDTFASSEIR